MPEQKKIRLKKDYDPEDTGRFQAKDKETLRIKTEKLLEDLDSLQELLYVAADQSLLIVFQAMDTGGKDGVIKNVMKGINPQGCYVYSFKKPTPIEQAHDFLWRVHAEVPPKRMIAIFNRSHYEDVLVPWVHDLLSGEEIEKRYKQINQFEKSLARNGTRILKFFLHISKEEQRERLEERIKNPKKRWKFNMQDLEERKLWSKYQSAYEQAISATSTAHAPWHVVPANHKWYRNFVVAETIVQTLKKMNLKFPPEPAGLDFDKIKIN